MIDARVGGLLSATLRAAGPLLFAATGELLAESSGVLNVGLEGVIAVGAVAAYFADAAGGPLAGLAAGALAGLALISLFGLAILRFRADQIIAGTAVTMLGLGISGTIFRLAAPATGAINVPTLAPLGAAFLQQPATTYLALVALGAVALILRHTVLGVAIRGAGERPDAIAALGHSVTLIRVLVIGCAGVLGGLAGATLVVAQAGVFSDGMSAGRGFIALAIVALGRWRAGGVLIGALIFGAVSALQFLAQTLGWGVPYSIVLALPYVATLAGLALVRGARLAPAALGRADDEAGR